MYSVLPTLSSLERRSDSDLKGGVFSRVLFKCTKRTSPLNASLLLD